MILCYTHRSLPIPVVIRDPQPNIRLTSGNPVEEEEERLWELRRSWSVSDCYLLLGPFLPTSLSHLALIGKLVPSLTTTWYAMPD